MLFTDVLCSNRDFLFLYKKGKTLVTKALVVYYRKSGRSYNRMGITSSKKIGNAVVRNRARRVVRAAYREAEASFPIGYDYIFVARGSLAGMKSYHVKKILREKVVPALNELGKQ